MSLAAASLLSNACQVNRDNPFDPKAPVALRAKAQITGSVTLEGGGDTTTIRADANSALGAGNAQSTFEATVQSNGTFAVEVPSGTYNIEIGGAGFESANFTAISIQPGDSFSLGAVTLSIARGLVLGQVGLASGGLGRDAGPASGAQVVLTKTDGLGLALVTGTGSDGHFRLDNVPAGSYEVRASLLGYAPSYTASAFSVSADVTNTAPTLQLYPASAIVQIAADGTVGAAYTADRNVDVQLLAFVPQLAQMRVSSDSTFTDPTEGDVDYRSFSATTAFTLLDLDGTQNVYAQFLDGTGQATDVFNASIVLDRAPPDVTTLSIDSGAAWLTSNVGQVTADGFDALSGIRGYRLSIDGVIDTEPEVSALAAPGATSLVLPEDFGTVDGPKSVLFEWIDRAGNVSLPMTATIAEDTTPPALATFSVTTALGNSVNVALSVSATDAAQMLVANTSDFAGAAWQAYAPTLAWALPPGDGTKTVFLRLRDAAGNVASDAQAQTILDTTPPNPVALQINNGATATTTANVALSLNAADANGVGMMLVSNFPTFSGATPVPYGTSLPWTLATLAGTQFVYARFFDNAGNSADTSAFILLDTTGPGSGAITILQGAFTNTTNVDLALSALGASVMRISGDVAASSNTLSDISYATSETVPLSTSGCTIGAGGTIAGCLRTVTVTYLDQYGAQSAAVSTSVTLDNVPPQNLSLAVSGTIADGVASATTTGTANVTLTLGSSDAATFAVSNTSDFSASTWQPFTTSPVAWALSAGDGAKSVFVEFRDAALNVSAPLTASITLDTTPPSSGTLLLNSGVASTNNTSVTASIGFAADALQMRLSTDGIFDTEPWVASASPQAVSLPSGDGTKSVFAEFRDKAGNVSTPISANITLDTVPPPTPVVSLNGGATYTTTASVTVGITNAGDATQMQVATGSVCSGPFVAFAASSLVTLPAPDCVALGCKSVTVCLRDAAGNTGSSGNASITLDTTAPTASANPSSGAVIGPAFPIVITFSEAIDQSSLTLGGALAAEANTAVWNAASTQLTVSPNPTWAGGSGQNLVVGAKDLAGNSLSPLTLSYVVDATPPVATPTPANAALFGAAQKIVVHFSKTVKTSTLLLGGSLAPLSNGGVFSTTTTTNDTLTLSPTSSWPAGAATLTLSVSDLFGNAATPLSLSYTVDTTTPLPVANPVTGTTIGPNKVIVLTFNESMDTTTVAIGGSMSTQAAAPAWSTTTNTNDTLTLSSPGGWSGGSGRTLIINGKDLAGNAMSPFTVTYTVDATAPTFTSAVPATGGTLGTSGSVTIHFSKTLLRSSLTLGGALGGLAALPTWQTVSHTDDTIVVTPAAGWSGGSGQTLVVNATDLFGNALSTLTLTYTVDASQATASSPNVPTFINSTAITILFTKSMTPGSLALGGNIGTPSATTWSTVTHTNDKLQLTAPVAGWTEGAGRTLTVSANDSVGNALATNPTSFSFNVIDHVVYVQTTGADTNPGTDDSPLLTITAAISAAHGFYPSTASEVQVAEGTYDVTYAASSGTHVVMVNKVSVLGGYSAASWSVRDFAAHPTLIVDTSAAGTSSEPSRAVDCGSAVTSTTTLEGFFIQGGTGPFTAAVVCESSSPTIAYNRLLGGTASTASTAFLSDASPLVFNNLISGGKSPTTTGVWARGSSGLSLYNNTIDAGVADPTTGTAFGIFMDDNANIDIENNIVVVSSGSLSYCGFENATNADPAAITDNDFVGCATALYGNFVGGTSGSCGTPDTNDCVLTTSALNALSNSNGNISILPVFTNFAGADTLPETLLDNDWSLDPATDSSISQGGVNGASNGFGFGDDLVPVTRTAPWTIGAYERD